MDELTSFDIGEDCSPGAGNIEQMHYLSVKVELMKKKLCQNIEDKTNEDDEDCLEDYK